MKDQDHTPYNICNFQSSEERLGNHNPVAPCSKPQRIVLSHKQFESHIGTLVDLNSLKGKTINENSKVSKCMEWLLTDACKRSNGGASVFGINQGKLRKDKNNPSGLFPSKTLSKSVKNLVHHELIVKVCDYNRFKNSDMFKLGDTIMELLDPVIVDAKFNNKARKETIELFRSMGINPNDKKICPCCRQLLFVTKFKIHEHDNASIQMVNPVCKECEYKNTVVKNTQRAKGLPEASIDGYKTAWSAFFLEKEQLGNMTISEREVLDQHKRIEDKMIKQLLEG